MGMTAGMKTPIQAVSELVWSEAERADGGVCLDIETLEFVIELLENTLFPRR